MSEKKTMQSGNRWYSIVVRFADLTGGACVVWIVSDFCFHLRILHLLLIIWSLGCKVLILTGPWMQCFFADLQ